MTWFYIVRKSSGRTSFTSLLRRKLVKIIFNQSESTKIKWIYHHKIPLKRYQDHKDRFIIDGVSSILSSRPPGNKLPPTGGSKAKKKFGPPPFSTAWVKINENMQTKKSILTRKSYGNTSRPALICYSVPMHQACHNVLYFLSMVKAHIAVYFRQIP